MMVELQYLFYFVMNMFDVGYVFCVLLFVMSDVVFGNCVVVFVFIVIYVLVKQFMLFVFVYFNDIVLCVLLLNVFLNVDSNWLCVIVLFVFVCRNVLNDVLLSWLIMFDVWFQYVLGVVEFEQVLCLNYLCLLRQDVMFGMYVESVLCVVLLIGYVFMLYYWCVLLRLMLFCGMLQQNGWLLLQWFGYSLCSDRFVVVYDLVRFVYFGVLCDVQKFGFYDVVSNRQLQLVCVVVCSDMEVMVSVVVVWVSVLSMVCFFGKGLWLWDVL